MGNKQSGNYTILILGASIYLLIGCSHTANPLCPLSLPTLHVLALARGLFTWPMAASSTAIWHPLPLHLLPALSAHPALLRAYALCLLLLPLTHAAHPLCPPALKDVKKDDACAC